MQGDSRTATFARVGRSYPRLAPSPAADEGRIRRGAWRRYGAAAAVVAVLAALGVLGWLLAR